MHDYLDALALIQNFGADRLDILADREQCERDLAVFFRRAWPNMDPAPYSHNWHIDAIADHLMAVTDGGIKKLLINVPFRTSKTLLTSVAWQCWSWAQHKRGPRAGPQVKFMCLSYASTLSLESATTARRLISSKWYQDRWGDIVKIDPKQDNKEKFDTRAMGTRISIGFDGGSMGRGGDIRIIDDPHKIKQLESEDVRQGTILTYDEALASRFTDPETTAEVIIMQRLHTDDLSGHVLEKYRDFVHLMLPMEYDPLRHCVTVLGWQDPRGIDEDGNKLEGVGQDDSGKPVVVQGTPMAEAEGTLLWATRFTPAVIASLKTSLGPYGTAGQLQQAPTPRGGGLIMGEWWINWPSSQFPDFRFVLVSVDTAQTEKEINDEAGITVLGIFDAPDWVDRAGVTPGQPCVMLINAWEGHLQFKPLVDKVAEFCKTHKADVCLVEGKSNGIDVINEIKRLHGTRDWDTKQFDPKTDKVSRLLSVQAIFSGEHYSDPVTKQQTWRGGIVYAPDRDFADLVITRVSDFPKGRRKAIVDTISQGLMWLRQQGYILTLEEHEAEVEEELRYKPESKPLYDV